jgi:hypothetical protein
MPFIEELDPVIDIPDIDDPDAGVEAEALVEAGTMATASGTSTTARAEATAPNR